MFLFFFLHYYLAPLNIEMRPFGMLSQGVIVICVIFWLSDLPFERAMYLFIVSATIASVMASVYVLSLYLNDIDVMIMRLGWGDESRTIRNINFISQSVFIYSTFTLYQAFFREKNNKMFALLFLIQFIFIVLSGTKRAIIGLPVFYLVFTFLNHRKSFFKYVIPAILGIGLFGYLLINIEFLYNIAGYRLEGMLYAFGIIEDSRYYIWDSSTEGRKLVYIAAFNMIFDTPLLGHGFAYFQTHSVGFNSSIHVLHTHNNYLELFLNYGFVGFVLYYSIFIRTTLRLIRRKNKTIMTYFFLTFFFVLYFIIEPSSVTFNVLPIYYLYLYFAYMYSWKQDSYSPNNKMLKSEENINQSNFYKYI